MRKKLDYKTLFYILWDENDTFYFKGVIIDVYFVIVFFHISAVCFINERRETFMSTNYDRLRESCKDVIDKNLKTTDMLNIKMFTEGYANLFREENGLKFYKYYKPTYHAIRNFEEDMLMCSNPKAFNDIFEGMVKSSELKPEMVYPIIRDICDVVSISCFSETWDNLLMYAHYTDSFKGFCVEYNFDYIKKKMPWIYFFPVIYQSGPSSLAQMEKLKIDIASVINGIKTEKIVLKKLDDIISYFIHKANIWSYEKEWRFIIPITQYKNYFGKYDLKTDRHFIHKFDCVSAVYLAANIDEIHKKHICEIVDRKNEERRSMSGDRKEPIVVYQTRIKESEYALVADQLYISAR